jgi:hypothetical protein
MANSNVPAGDHDAPLSTAQHSTLRTCIALSERASAAASTCRLALEAQDAEHDHDIASCLGHCVEDEIEDVIDALKALYSQITTPEGDTHE